MCRAQRQQDGEGDTVEGAEDSVVFSLKGSSQKPTLDSVAYVSISQDFKHAASRICRQTESSHLDSEWLWAAQSPAAVPGILVTAPQPVLGWTRVTVLPTWKLESVEETDREQMLVP